MQQENLGQSVSLWMATTAVPNQSTLGEDTHADVCVVGAGIAGITTAYLLAKQDSSMVAQVLGFMAPSRPPGVIGALLGMAERPDATASLVQIAVPTLVITGADDTLIPPAESETLAQAIRGAQLEVIPQAGHLVAFERPDEFNRILMEWLNRASLALSDDRN